MVLRIEEEPGKTPAPTEFVAIKGTYLLLTGLTLQRSNKGKAPPLLPTSY